jgi:glutamate/aspartate transport system permease protein
MFTGFDFDVIARSAPYLFREGMTFTLTLTAMAMTGGIFFGTLLAMMRLSSHKWLNLPAGAYVNLMRSVPLVLVIFWFYFLVPYIGAWVIGAKQPIQVGAFWSSVITFHDVRGGLLRRDHARRHPERAARSGLGRATRWA